MLTGTVVVDVTECARGRMRHRLLCLNEVPTGARLIIRVGALAPEPEVVRLIAAHEPRLHVDVQGTSFAVGRWLEALRTTKSQELLP